MSEHYNECSDASHRIKILLKKLKVSSCLPSRGGQLSGVLVFCPDGIQKEKEGGIKYTPEVSGYEPLVEGVAHTEPGDLPGEDLWVKAVLV